MEDIKGVLFLILATWLCSKETRLVSDEAEGSTTWESSHETTALRRRFSLTNEQCCLEH